MNTSGHAVAHHRRAQTTIRLSGCGLATLTLMLALFADFAFAQPAFVQPSLVRPEFVELAAPKPLIAAPMVDAQPIGLSTTTDSRRGDARLRESERNAPHLVLSAPAAGRVAELRLLAEPPRTPAASRASWWAPVASVILPGSGQALLRQQRALAYLVAETFVVLQASRAKNDFESARTRYRSIAADVARLQFGTDRPVAPWDYYETMADVKWTASGKYDVGLGGKFTPEPDESTYNGSQWLLARSLYWANPADRPAESSVEYQKAIAFYQARAYKDNFRWSWRDNQNAKELYVQTIKEANNSNQRRVSMVGLVAANHLLSLVDSYVTVRLRRYGGAGLVSASIESELRPSGIPGDNSIASALKLSLPIPGSGRRP